MKKISVLSILPGLLLASCGSFKPYGTYQFRLGKTDGNHLEMTTVLSEEEHSTQKGYKKLSLTADLGDSMSPTAIIEQYGEKYPILEPFLDIIVAELKDFDHVDGFYKLTDQKDEKLGYRVEIGSDMLVTYLKKLADKYQSVKDIIDALSITDEDVTFMPSQTRNIFNAFVNNKTFTVQIPVSGDDLTMQMLWYGKGSQITDPNYLERMPGVKGEARFGTHPKVVKKNNVVTLDEVAMVNKEFQRDFSNTILYEDSTCFLELGRLAMEEVNGKNQLKVFLKDGYEGSRSNIVGYVKTKDDLGDFDDINEIKFSLDDKNFTNCIHNGKEGKDEGFSDENGNPFVFSKLIQDPFEFRDFHVVNVGLAKVVD